MSNKVQWQETLLHEGTEEERDAAFAAAPSNRQHFVFGGPRKDTPTTEPKPYPKGTAKDQVDDLNARMKASRERREGRMSGGSAYSGTHPSSQKSKKPTKPAPRSEAEQAAESLSAFMGHGR
jgi:hypothetical protein